MRPFPLLLLTVAAISGCASKPHDTRNAPPTAAPKPSAPPPAATSAAGASSAPNSASAASRDPKLAARYPPGVNIDLIKQGYAVADKNGEFVYCRKDVPTGSRFTQRVCLTEKQIKDNETSARDALRNMPNGVCSGVQAHCGN